MRIPYTVALYAIYIIWPRERALRLYEHEAKEILKARGIGVPKGLLVSRPESFLPLDSLIPAMGKVQTQRGRRQKLGGVVALDSAAAALDFVRRMLGRDFGGERVEHVLLEQRIVFEEEYFLGVTYDNSARRPVVLLSDHGGIDIEATAALQPERIDRLVINPRHEFRPYHACEWLSEL